MSKFIQALEDFEAAVRALENCEPEDEADIEIWYFEKKRELLQELSNVRMRVRTL